MAYKLAYEIARPSSLPAIHKLMYQSFWADEPMTRHLGLNKGEFTIKDGDAVVEHLIKDFNLSIMAKDSVTGTPLAVMLNGEFHRDELDMPRSEILSSCEDEEFKPVASILNEVQIKSKDYFYKNDITTAFDLKLLSVSPKARGMGLANDLVQKSVDLAKCLGYKMCKSEATGDYSRKAFLKAGFELEAECKYSEFMFEGETVFSGITDHQGTAFMVKLL